MRRATPHGTQQGWSEAGAPGSALQEVWHKYGQSLGLPRNTTLVISASGDVAAEYDKRRLYRGENSFYSPGDGTAVVRIRGVCCGFLVCYENCFPTMYEEYRRLGVEVVFHSFHNARNSEPTDIRHLMAASLLVRAADNGVYISAANSCAPYSPLPATIVRPDGSSVRARRNVTGLVVGDYPGSELGWTYSPE